MQSILIVEDNDDLRDLYGQIIEERGFEPLLAADGTEALQILRSRDKQPEFILLDLMMPGLDGWKFIDSLALEPAGRSRIPVVVCSAAGDRIPDGVIFLRKPVSLQQLQGVITRFTKRRPYLEPGGP